MGQTHYSSRNGLRGLFIITLLWIFPIFSDGQGVIPTKGKDFWVGFMENPDGTSPASKRLDIFITSEINTTGTVTVPLQGWSQNFTVTANQTTTVNVPNAVAEHIGSEIITNKGVRVLTADTVSVFAINFQRYSADGTQVYPKESIGTNYRVACYTGISGSFGVYPSEFLIVATEDGTQVEITPSAPTSGGRPVGVPFVINLNAGQSYQVKAANATVDLTGTTVVATNASGSCRPFAVFGGSMCTRVPDACTYCDHIYEQSLPVSFWGKTYYAVPFTPATRYALRFLAHQNSTTYTVNGGAPVTLNAGQFATVNNITTPSCIQSNNPLSVIQYMEGRTCAGAGDPAMLYLNAEEQKIDRVTFSTVASTVITQHKVNVIMKTVHINQLKRNGVAVPASSFIAFPSCPNYSYASITLTQGSHTLEADSGFTAYVYGTGQDESYAYSAGSFSKAQPVIVDSILCTSDTLRLGKIVPLFNHWWSTQTNPNDTIHVGPVLTLTPPITPDVYILHGNEFLSGCDKEYFFNVEVPTPPVLSVSKSADTVCQYQAVQLQANVTPNSAIYQYRWTPAAGLDNPNIANPIATPSVSTWYVVAVSTPTGCGGITYDSVYIFVKSGDLNKFKVTPNDTGICIGASVQLSMSIEKSVFEEEFDSTINNTIWNSTSGGIASNICGSLSGNALYFNSAGTRSATTNSLNLTSGGTIKFAIKIANGTAPCDDADFGEDVVLEYSVNGGGAWNNIATYNEASYPNFTVISVPIPVAAQTSNTMLRWRQLIHSGAGQDNWALDNVLIGVVNNSGLTFNWSPPTGLSNSNIQNPIATPSVSTLYVGQSVDNSTGCVYADSVFITVGQNFTLNTTPDTNLCVIGGIQLVTRPNLNGNYTYSWTPTSTLSNPAITNPIATPNSTTTYYVTVTSSAGCVQTDSVRVRVVSLASFNAIPDTAAICIGQSVQADVFKSNNCGTFNSVCAGTPDSAIVAYSTFTSTSVAISPYSGSYISSRRQYLYRASELIALGMTQGSTITQLAFRVLSVTGNGVFRNFTIKMGCTNLTQVTSTYVTGLQTVFNPQNITITPGFNNYVFNNSYDWDGTSNVIVEVCYENTAASSSSSIYYHGAGFTSSLYSYGGIGNCNVLTGTTSTNRPNTTFKYCTNPAGNLIYSWTPMVGVSNPLIRNPVLSPITNTVYHVIATDTLTGCVFKDSVRVKVGATFNLTASNDTFLCSISGVPLQATNNAGAGANYRWSPGSLLSDSTSANPIATPTTNTTYYVTVTSADGCSREDSVKVNVVSLSFFNAIPDTASICIGQSIQADIFKSNSCGAFGSLCVNNPDSAVVAYNTLTTTSANVSPYSGANLSARRQFLFRAAELNALGMTQGSTITQLAFRVLSVTGNGIFQNFTIKMGCTGLTQLTNTYVTGLQTVFNPQTITITPGFNNYILNSSYDWDGVSNLIVEVCYQNSTTSSNSSIYYHTTTFVSAIYTFGSTALCNALTGTTSSNRPNTTFKYCRTPARNLIYSWTPSLGVSNTGIRNPVLTPTVNTVYNVTAIDTVTGCVFNDSIKIKVGGVPFTITASSDTVVCSALGLNLNVITSQSGQYIYNWQPANNLNNPSVSNPIISVNGSQQYIITVSDSVGCSLARDTVNITVKPAAIITVSNDTAICPGNSVLLSAVGGSVYSWSPVTNLSNPTSPNPTATPQINTTYYITVTDSIGCVIQDSVIITLKESPTVNLGNDTAFCLGGQVLLSVDTVFDSYLWQDNSTSNTMMATTAGVYWLQVTNQCGTARDTVIVQTYAPPVVSLGNDTTTCFGQSVLLDASNPGATYWWSDSSTLQTLQVTNSGTYYVTVTDVNGCIGEDSAQVTFNAAQVNLQNDTAICSGQSVTLDAGNPGATYSWSNGANSQTIVVNTAAQYTVTITDNLNCSAQDSVLVIVNPLPVFSLGNDTTLCNGQTLNLNAGGINASTYLWSTNDSTTTITVNTTNSYSLTVTDSHNCSSSDSIFLSFKSLPQLTITNDTAICEGDSILLSAFASDGQVYQWTPVTGLSTPGSANTWAKPTGAITYRVTVYDSIQCSAQDSINISLNPLPVVRLANDTSFCVGGRVVFDAGSGFSSYLWQDLSTGQTYTASQAGSYWVRVTNQCGADDDTVRVLQLYPLPVINLGPGGYVCIPHTLDAGNPGATYQWSTGATSQIINPTASGNYSVTVTSSFGCVNNNSINIDLLDQPTISLGADTLLCDDNVLVLNAEYPNSTYSWQDGSNEYTYTVDKPGLYWVTVNNLCGSDRDSVLVEYSTCNCIMFIPNIFTPNDDNVNDVFRPEISCDIRYYVIKVFNRWGELVFESNDIEKGWDGTFKGSKQDPAVFIYKIEYVGVDDYKLVSFKRHGSVTLLR